jgi:hypothetical protein
VFPCNPDKTPATPHGFKDGTDDPAAVRCRWANHAWPLIGVATGAASGFDVLDIDPRHNGDEWYRANQYRLPNTRSHKTRGGGVHLLFRHEPGLRCSAGKETSGVAPGVDVRADGGYAIWWPAQGLQAHDVPIAQWPTWLLEQMRPKPRPKLFMTAFSFGSDRARRYAVAALRDAVRLVAAAGEGCRNDTLNAQTFAIARFVSEGALSASEIIEALSIAARVAGLPEDETARTVTSALKAASAV